MAKQIKRKGTSRNKSLEVLNEQVFVEVKDIGKIEISLNEKAAKRIQDYFDIICEQRLVKQISPDALVSQYQNDVIVKGFMSQGHALVDAFERAKLYYQKRTNEAQVHATMVALMDNNFEIDKVYSPSGRVLWKARLRNDLGQIELPNEETDEEEEYMRSMGKAPDLKHNLDNPLEQKLAIIDELIRLHAETKSTAESSMMDIVMDMFTRIAERIGRGDFTPEATEVDEAGFQPERLDNDSLAEINAISETV